MQYNSSAARYGRSELWPLAMPMKWAHPVHALVQALEDSQQSTSERLSGMAETYQVWRWPCAGGCNVGCRAGSPALWWSYGPGATVGAIQQWPAPSWHDSRALGWGSGGRGMGCRGGCCAGLQAVQDSQAQLEQAHQQVGEHMQAVASKLKVAPMPNAVPSA